MQVTIEYTDETAFVSAEAEQNAKHLFGEHARVTVKPDSNDPEDIIYFGIQQLITSDQLSLLFDRDKVYNKEVVGLRAGAISKITTLLDQVLIDNESRVN